MIGIDITHFHKYLFSVFIMIAWIYLGVACSGGGSAAITPAGNGAPVDDKRNKNDAKGDQSSSIL